MEEKDKKTEKKPETEHGENWVTHLYDKVDMPVQTLDKFIIALIVFIFALILIFAKK